MRVLNTTELSAFLKRFDNFKDAEFRSLDLLSPLQSRLTFAVQDSARAYDWITLTLLFNGISDAKLLQEHQLSLVDMSDGISLLYEDALFAFGIGECYNISTIKNSSCFILAQSLKYEEGLF